MGSLIAWCGEQGVGTGGGGGEEAIP